MKKSYFFFTKIDMQNSKIRKTFKDYENDYDEKIIVKKNLSGSQRRKNKQKRLVRMIGNYLDFGNSSGNELIKNILLFHPVTFDYFKQQRIFQGIKLVCKFSMF